MFNIYLLLASVPHCPCIPGSLDPQGSMYSEGTDWSGLCALRYTVRGTTQRPELIALILSV